MMSQIVLAKNRGQHNIERRKARKFRRRYMMQSQNKRMTASIPLPTPAIIEEKPTLMSRLKNIVHSSMKFIRRK